MNDLRSQLSPGWTGVNVGLTVVLFFLAPPLALLMLAYIVWGRRLGLDLGRLETFAAFGGRLGHAGRAARDAWRGHLPLSTGTPSAAASTRAPYAGGRPDDDTLHAERDALERERRAFEAEKRDWHGRREPAPREPLDS